MTYLERKPGERAYGYLYDKDRQVKDDAASIRRTIRTMAKAGVLPADWKYSVRYSSFAGGCAIDIAATSPRPTYAADPRPYDTTVYNRDTGEWVFNRIDRMSREARAVEDALEELHAAHNHDGSDSMTDYFDVKFYGSVRVDTAEGVPQYDAEVS